MRKTRLRLAAAVLPALVLAAACSGSSDGSKDADGKGGKATGSASASAPTSGADSPSDGSALTKAQLTKALIAEADVPGWTIQVSQTDDSADTSTLTADKPACQPLADITSSKPKIPRKAFVGAAFAKTTSSATPDAINQMLVASHAPGDAQKVIESVKTALGTCKSFTATDNTGTKTPFTISKGPAVPTGDEAVSYVMADTADKKSGAALVSVVRTGDTITAYLSVKSAGGAGTLPMDVARKQSEKLKAAQAK
ncbi:sensor domain-containing protein [Streptomyces sp. NPDC008139]|uniref:sensor domain-containing protein n=1 Tax=Streptomyces sp. NPDC008139 TaxID=3364814 RepID=UPI0036EB081D